MSRLYIILRYNPGQSLCCKANLIFEQMIFYGHWAIFFFDFLFSQQEIEKENRKALL
ncbi:hypothetical protein J2S04_001319 [Alicyclobacillus tengchongensis]|uniref:Uncharacterized protein n=2 Tax=Alicyclobacillus tolerans TaxID=90970 RepID=A0A1M6Q2I3_9BACL|nr:hypothetical protein [Alicyclobacillus tengchongensis]SHK14403.1 hypothetical protein SAMN05443507_10935 [Alicyclobacillus montanus]